MSLDLEFPLEFVVLVLQDELGDHNALLDRQHEDRRGAVRNDQRAASPTAFDCYAVTAFELMALDYLLMPFGRSRRLDAGRFVRVHRSHLVNIDHVAELRRGEDGRLELRRRDGARLTASRTRSRELRQLAI